MVALAQVDEPYRRALTECAADRGLGVVELDGEATSVPRGGRVVLGVLGLNGEGQKCRVADAPIDAGRSAACGPCRVCSCLRCMRHMVGASPVVIVARGLTVGLAVRLIRLGAVDVIEIPAPPQRVAERSFAFYQGGGDVDEPSGIVGDSEAMRSVRRSVASVARHGSTVLITGETGTGKGLVARAIHRLSRRRRRPFVHVDCTALPASIIESELFGHERGSFTGAAQRRVGRFELAQDGTIFLDEIGDLELPLQAKLMRVVEEREFERVGGNRTLHMSARVVAATNRDLPAQIEAGRFRRDLFFRMAVFQLQLPPLRGRAEDIPVLARHILKELAASAGGPPVAIDNALCARLARHDWPGNVRELTNVLERLYVQRIDDTLDATDLEGILEALAISCPPVPKPADERFAEVSVATPRRSEAVRPSTIAAALSATGGNVARAARRLRLPRSTLRYWIKQHQLDGMIPTD